MDELTAIAELPAEGIAAIGHFLEIRPEAVADARRYTARFLFDEAKLDGDHLDDVVLVVSELVTNAIKYGGGGRRIHLELGIWSKWTMITVDDRTREVYEPASVEAEDEDLRDSGRGLLIVQSLAERFWWHRRQFGKTANAVILRPDVKLTDEDRAFLDRLETDG